MNKEERIVKIVSDTVVVTAVSAAVGAACKVTRSGWPLLAMVLIPGLKAVVTTPWLGYDTGKCCSCVNHGTAVVNNVTSEEKKEEE